MGLSPPSFHSVGHLVPADSNINHSQAAFSPEGTWQAACASGAPRARGRSVHWTEPGSLTHRLPLLGKSHSLGLQRRQNILYFVIIRSLSIQTSVIICEVMVGQYMLHATSQG